MIAARPLNGVSKLTVATDAAITARTVRCVMTPSRHRAEAIPLPWAKYPSRLAGQSRVVVRAPLLLGRTAGPDHERGPAAMHPWTLRALNSVMAVAA